MNLNCPGEYSHSVVVLNVMIQEQTHQYALLMGQLISSYQVIIHCLNCLLYYILKACCWWNSSGVGTSVCYIMLFARIRFPLNDENLLTKWLTMVNVKQVTKFSRICSVHFTKDSFCEVCSFWWYSLFYSVIERYVEADLRLVACRLAVGSICWCRCWNELSSIHFQSI